MEVLKVLKAKQYVKSDVGSNIYIWVGFKIIQLQNIRLFLVAHILNQQTQHMKIHGK